MAEALRLCHDEAAAEDLVMRTFERYFFRRSLYDSRRGSLFTWLRSVMRNLHTDGLRKRKVSEVLMSPDEIERAIDAQLPQDPAEYPGDQTLRDEHMLCEAVAALPPKLREAVVLHYFESLPLSEVARTLRVSENSIKNRLYYARKVLMKRLGKKLGRGGIVTAFIAMFALVSVGAVITIDAFAPVRETVAGWFSGAPNRMAGAGDSFRTDVSEDGKALDVATTETDGTERPCPTDESMSGSGLESERTIEYVRSDLNGEVRRGKSADGDEEAFVMVRTKKEFLDVVAKAVDESGRLKRGLNIVFADDCETMVIDADEMCDASAECLLDCNGHMIRLDADRCPYGTVVFGKEDPGGEENFRGDSFRSCGKGSEFRNLIFMNLGRLDFASRADTQVKDCDFVGCGTVASSAAETDGGAIHGCEVVDGCGFDGCQARSGGAIADCGYVRECVFLNCRAYDGGGAIVGESDITRCEFHGCSCVSEAANDGFGGAVYGGRDIVSCLFVDCSAKYGGAVMTDTGRDGAHAKVVHCTFVRCLGEADDEAVFECAVDQPVWMLNSLFYGCGRWQNGADEKSKFSSYQLLDSGFFADYARGDYHPNPELKDDWVDPCGLGFNDVDCGTMVFVCRDLDGYGYQMESRWPNCPGCYRFRSLEYRSNVMPNVARPERSRVFPKKVNSPAVRRGTSVPKKQLPQYQPSDTSVRNSPVKVISRRTGPAVLDLSELPCEFTYNEILHEGDDFMDFLAPWYERNSDFTRFYEQCGPHKMPEFGIDPGYGRPGEMLPYDEDEELKSLERPYGFRSGWFRPGAPKPGEKDFPRWSELNRKERAANAGQGVQTSDDEKIPFLFSEADGNGPAPLVVYIAGSGERGTDLKKMFRQTALFDAVRAFASVPGRACHLLAIMPPESSRGSFVFYPHTYRGCVGDPCCNYPFFGPGVANLYFIRMYADLVFAVQRELEEKGGATVDPDAIVVAGLGSGASAAATMMREYPGRFAGACLTYPSPRFESTANRYRPGRWWFAMSDAFHEIDGQVNAVVSAYRKLGAEVRTDYYPDVENWWNQQYASPEFGRWLAECFDKGPLHGERLIVSRPERRGELLIAKTGPDVATYYGTTENHPEGLPADVSDRRIRDLKGIRFLYVDAKAGQIPPEAFLRSPDLETVCLMNNCLVTNADHKTYYANGYVTNIGERAFAESSKLKLVIFANESTRRIGGNAFEGCARGLIGATVGVPVGEIEKILHGTNGTVQVVYSKKFDLGSDVLPVDGLFGKRLFLSDDQLGRRLYVENDYLWSEEGAGAIALMYIGDERDVFVPATLGGRPVVAVGRHLLHRRGGFEYGVVAFPSTVRKAALFPEPIVKTFFAAGAIPEGVRWALAPDAVVYGTTPDEKTGRLVPSPFWNGTEIVVPKGTDPHEFFALKKRP